VPKQDVLRGLDRDLVDVDREHLGRAEAQCGERVEARPAADVEERTSLERLYAEQSLQLRRRMLDPLLIEQTAELLPVPAELECGGPIVCRRLLEIDLGCGMHIGPFRRIEARHRRCMLVRLTCFTTSDKAVMNFSSDPRGAF